MKNDELRLNINGLRRFSEKVFESYGLSKENARIVADCLAEADLLGATSHGTVRLKSYLQRAKNENWNPDPDIKFTVKGAACAVDGDDGFGAIVGVAAMNKAIELAGEYGVGLCSVRRSSHFGMAGYYSLMAAKRDMIGFCCSNGVSNLAPFGSREGRLGTSPFAFAVPVEGGAPILLDISCGVTARGKISNAKREGQSIPSNWAMGRDGRPTTDPEEALLAGALLPFGGHKGSGIAMMIDVMCGVLSGAATSLHVREDKSVGPDVGHTFLAIDVSAFQPAGEFKAGTKSFYGEMKASKPAIGAEEVFVPGEQAAKRRIYNLEHGVKMGAGGFAELREVCESYGIDEDLNSYIIEEQGESI